MLLIKRGEWDLTGRKGNMPSSGGEVVVTEFDYSKVGVVYQQTGVTIKSWPAVHAIDGSVSYCLEWKGMKFVSIMMDHLPWLMT